MNQETALFGGEEQAAARANAYHTLAVAISSPTDWPLSFHKDLRGRFSEFGGDLALRAHDLADAIGLGRLQRKNITVAHTRLLVGPYSVEVAPWASMYLGEEKQLMGAVSQFAADAYAEAGLSPSSGRQDAPDHIEHELEFMYYLAFEEASTGEPIWQIRQHRFWRQHLGRWLPELAFTIRLKAHHPYYLALAQLLLTFAEKEKAHFDALGLP